MHTRDRYAQQEAVFDTPNFIFYGIVLQAK
jgi:hypothetical protein